MKLEIVPMRISGKVRTNVKGMNNERQIMTEIAVNANIPTIEKGATAIMMVMRLKMNTIIVVAIQKQRISIANLTIQTLKM